MTVYGYAGLTSKECREIEARNKEASVRRELRKNNLILRKKTEDGEASYQIENTQGVAVHGNGYGLSLEDALYYSRELYQDRKKAEL